MAGFLRMMMVTEKTQRERFEETARLLECDEDETKFNADLRKIAKAKTEKKSPTLNSIGPHIQVAVFPLN